MIKLASKPHITKMNETIKRVKNKSNQHYSINRVTLVTQEIS